MNSNKYDNILNVVIYVNIAIMLSLSSSYAYAEFDDATTSNSIFAQTQGEFSIPMEQLITEKSAVLGNDDASITIFDFSDFQCPMCARYSKNTEPLIVENYVNKGDVKIVYKHFAILGQDSISAAKVSQCANEQGYFWEFNKILYKNQRGSNSGWAGKENLIEYASQIPQINIESLKSCIETTKYDSVIENDLLQAKTYAFLGTPAFIIVNSDGSNPEILVGAHAFPSFQSIIDKKLLEQ